MTPITPSGVGSSESRSLLMVGIGYRLVEMFSTQWTIPETNVFDCFIITGVLRRLILCFSFYSNTKSLISTEGPPGMISCLNGMRFFSITWVISGHSVLFYLLTVIGKLSSLYPEHELSSLRHGPIISLSCPQHETFIIEDKQILPCEAKRIYPQSEQRIAFVTPIFFFKTNCKSTTHSFC